MMQISRVKLSALAAGVLALFAISACGGSAYQSVKEVDTSDSELSQTSSSLAALGNLAGRYSGEVTLPRSGMRLVKETRKVGLLIEKLPDDNNYVAIVIRYTNFLKDNFPENLGRGIDRVVENVSIYRVVPKMADTAVLTLQPLVFRNGEIVAAEVNPSQQLSELRISPKQSHGIAGAFAALRRNPVQHQAEITAGSAGEPLAIQFKTFLQNAEVPTSTWDREFIADSWESTYFFADTLAVTKRSQNQMVLDVTESSEIKGSYVMAEAGYRNSDRSVLQKIPGLYAMTPATAGTSNPLEARLGIFIDVVNRKNLGFATRELFLIDPSANGAKYSETNPKGFIMYFQKDRINLKRSDK